MAFTLEIQGGPQDGDKHYMVVWPGDVVAVWNQDKTKALELKGVTGQTGNELHITIYTRPP